MNDLKEDSPELRQRFSNSRSSSSPEKDDELPGTSKVESGPHGRIEQDVNMQKLRDRSQRLKSDVLEQMEEFLEEYMQDVESIESPTSVNGSAFGNKRRKKGDLPDKEFITRKSVLTDLLEISHIRTIYHIFVAILIIFILNTVVHDAIETGRVSLDFELIQWCFGKFPLVISLWGCMKLATVIVVYPAFQFWAYNRLPGHPVYWFDLLGLGLYILYQVIFMVIPVRTILMYKLPIASCVIILCEQVRLLMKAHAFVRHNIPRGLKFNPENGTSEDNEPCPDFSKYLYFLFAPTLVYRDSYPRTVHIRWNYVVSNFVQVLACLFYIYFIMERFCVPVFRDFNKEHIALRNFVLSVFGCMMPATLVLFIGFFCLLHSWMNAFAEMLRFGDRMFYKDWWNSSSFSNYYRTWNVVVHDWLYTYIYRDVFMMLGCRSRPSAMLSVFLLSAVFHEYILTLSFGFFYPVLFVMFAGAGFAFIFLTNKHSPRSGNVFMWVMLFIGNGALMALYSMEWYARLNCQPIMNNSLDFWVPRTWNCIQTTAASTDVHTSDNILT